jgi:hypothetical protein
VDSSNGFVGERPALAHCLVFQETVRAGGALPSLAFFGYFFEQCKKVTIEALFLCLYDIDRHVINP